MSREDYMRVASTIADLDLESGFAAAEIHEGTITAELDESLPNRKVPLTQVYVCLRFWQEFCLVVRAGGCRFRNAVMEEGSFLEAAEAIWVNPELHTE